MKYDLKEFNKALVKDNDFDLEKQCSSDLPERLNDLIDNIINKEAGKIEADAGDIEIYDVALDMEKRGYDAYKNASLDNEEDLRDKTFFKFLSDQEIVHYNLLKESKKYLQDSSYYFEDYGGWIFNE